MNNYSLKGAARLTRTYLDVYDTFATTDISSMIAVLFFTCDRQ